jgi:hypothetical protein
VQQIETAVGQDDRYAFRAPLPDALDKLRKREDFGICTLQLNPP